MQWSLGARVAPALATLGVVGYLAVKRRVPRLALTWAWVYLAIQIGIGVFDGLARMRMASVFGPITGPAYVDSLSDYLASFSIVGFSLLLTAPAVHALRDGYEWPQLPQWLLALLMILLATIGCASLTLLATKCMVFPP